MSPWTSYFWLIQGHEAKFPTRAERWLREDLQMLAASPQLQLGLGLRHENKRKSPETAGFLLNLE